MSFVEMCVIYIFNEISKEKCFEWVAENDNQIFISLDLGFPPDTMALLSMEM